MGKCNGDAISHKPHCPEEEQSAWSISGTLEAGLVRGIPAGHYATSANNKAYAVRAAALLIEGKQNWSTSALWRAVEFDPAKTHNGQMDIVLALWKNGLIVRKT
jgi:hypothetical protein